MSQSSIIAEVSVTILKQLNETLKTIQSSPSVELAPPKETHEKDIVSLWLYQVSRNGDVANNDRVWTGTGELPHRPLPVDLHYLITPQFKVPDAEQKVLGKIMQFFHSYPGLMSSPQGLSDDVKLRISPEFLTFEQHMHLWQALSQPFRLSVSYLVQCVRIDSLLPAVKAPPVEKSDVRFSQIITANEN